jgi:hypothetical protein
MLISRVLQSDDSTILNLVQFYITDNDVTATNPSTSVEAAAMDQLLCVLRDEQKHPNSTFLHCSSSAE